jgi:hypothetical protein
VSAATAQSLPTTSAPLSDGIHRRPLPWPRRRRWLSRVSRAAQLTSGCRAWLLLLATRSDDLGKPVWGTQERMSAQLGLSARTVRRYVAEAEAAGFVKVTRSAPLRAPDGRFYRRASNVYWLTTPVAEPQGATEGPRRRPKAGYCVLKPTPHLGDTHGPSTAPLGQGEPPAAPASAPDADEQGEIQAQLDPDVFHDGVAQLKLRLRGARPGGLRR